MCIRSPFAAAIAAALIDETFIDTRDHDPALELLVRAPEATFGHPLALARHMVKHAIVDEDMFGDCARVIGPIVRGYRRLRKNHGDLFAGTPHALPSLADGYRRAARVTRRHAAKPKREGSRLERQYAAAAALGVEQRSVAERARRDAVTGAVRPLPRNVVDLAAVRAKREATC